MIKILIFIVLTQFIGSDYLYAQSFAPAPGNVGSTAIFKDSSIVSRWATGIDVQRGYLDIGNKSLGFASNGASNDGMLAEGDVTSIVSLGDSGVAILTFDSPIMNVNGYDFAIFENGFDDDYLELGHVEVSSDGINYTRFPSITEIQTSTQINSFSFTDCRLVNNLAGKYRTGWGTPFDLNELAGSPNLNLNAITHVKIIDVVGSIQSNLGSTDGQGTIINDGYPSNFAAGGFDLDGVAVLNEQITSLDELSSSLTVYPNPCKNSLSFSGEIVDEIDVFNLSGAKVLFAKNVSTLTFDLAPGIYILQIAKDNKRYQEKVIIAP
ncbi:MAG: T9SS type A sorting domain-containing protein [Bacteroidota bacterium]